MTVWHKFRRLLRLIAILLNPNFNSRKWIKRTKAESKTGYLAIKDAQSNSVIWDEVKLKPGQFVLEIGSNCGNRFLRVALENPNVTFVGIDINSKAIELGNETAAEMGLKNVFLYTLPAEKIINLLKIYPGGFDFVYSWATLIYIHPIRIKMVLNQLCTVAKNQIVLIEQHMDSLNIWPLHFGIPIQSGPNFVRNYNRLIREISKTQGKNFFITATSLPLTHWNPGGGHGHKIIIVKED